MRDLPEGWKLARLDEVAEVKLGRQRSPSAHTGDRMRPYLRAANVGWNTLRLEDVKEMVFSEDEDRTYLLEPMDILVVEASGSPAEVGKSVVYRGVPPDVRFQNTLLRVRCYEVDPEFIQLQLLASALSGDFIQGTKGVGINHLSRAGLAKWAVAVPPLDEQRRIVAILEDHLAHLDAATQHLHAAELQLATWAQAQISGSKSPNAPLVRLDSIAEVRLGRQRSPATHSGERMRRYLRAANVDWNRLRLDDVNEMVFTEPEDAIYLLRPKDILVVEASGSPAEVGKSVMYRGDPADVRFQNTLLRVRCGRAADPGYVQTWLLLTAMAGGFRDSSRGVGINHLSRARLARWLLPLPDIAAQRRTAVLAQQALRGTDSLQHRIHATRMQGETLRRSLLTAAFRGDLTADWHADPARSSESEMSAAPGKLDVPEMEGTP